MTLEEYQRLLRLKETCQRDESRAEGIMQGIERQWKEEFACGMDEAKVAELTAEQAKLEQELAAMVEKLKQDFPQLG